MNICMVLADVDFPPDIRVEKEARSLISAGHRVILLCPRTGDRPALETWNGIEIHRLGLLPRLLQKLNSFIFILSFRDLHWKRAIRKLIKEKCIDVVHVHDLPMVGTALAAARRRRLPVVADLHENYAGWVRLTFAHRRPRLAERLMWPARWERVERRWGMRCVHIIAVVDEMKERLLAKGVPPDKITVVENTVDADYLLSLQIDNRIVDRFRRDFVICFTGRFSSDRGLDLAIAAMPRILGSLPEAKLLLVGDGGILPQVRSLVKTAGVEDKVVFAGWQPFDSLPSYIAASDVCVVPYSPSEQTDASSPNKLFLYMLMGKPVVVSSCRSLRRVVEECGAGLVFEAGNADSYAQAILCLKDPVVRNQLAEAGRKAALEKYNWRGTSQKLLSLYEGLSATGKQANQRG